VSEAWRAEKAESMSPSKVGLRGCRIRGSWDGGGWVGLGLVVSTVRGGGGCLVGLGAGTSGYLNSAAVRGTGFRGDWGGPGLLKSVVSMGGNFATAFCLPSLDSDVLLKTSAGFVGRAADSVTLGFGVAGFALGAGNAFVSAAAGIYC
jgi:hypothetical protein